MAFSGDKTWGLTRDDIIAAALRKCGAYDSANGATATEIADAATSLNAIIKEWSAEGLGIWLRQKTIVFLNRGQPYYWLGPNPTNSATNRIYHQACADSVYKEAPLSADLAGGATILTIADTAWLDANRQTATKPTATGPPQIGIRLDDLTIHWTTIAAVGTDTVTISAGLPAAASAGAMVYSFLTRTSRPIRCLLAYRTSTDGIDNEVTLIGRTAYEQLSSKYASGEPTQVSFEATITEQTSSALHSMLHVWPVQNSISCDRLGLLTEHYADDMDAAGNNPQFPAEYANALIWNLAAEMADEYDVPPVKLAGIVRRAEVKKANVIAASDMENASLLLQPERR